MNNQLMIIGSMAMDLKRAALGSEKVSEIFIKEALKRKSEINIESLPLYVRNILKNIGVREDKEDLMMYSTLLQNYTLSYGK